MSTNQAAPAPTPAQSSPQPIHHPDHDVFLLPTRVDRSDTPLDLNIVLLVPLSPDNVENYHATIRVESAGADHWRIRCHELPGISVSNARLADALRDIGPKLVEGIKAWKATGKPFHRDLCPLTQDRLPDTFTLTIVR
jgi:hypothetical protein